MYGAACNGVFKGGGAKGIAYIGALQACEQAGIGFEAVAGSSAGAITAALVAAGFDSDELEEHLPKGLQTLDHPVGAFLRVTRSSLLSGRRLRAWLENALTSKVRVSAQHNRPCTFEELFAYSSIGLYVVAMDLATRQPVVFSHELTPHMSVADAVIASSAIPVAFPPALVQAEGQVRRLVDGGAYANYPSFIFDDPAFRAYHGLTGDPDALTLGFILDEREEPVTPLTRDVQPFSERRFDSDQGSATRELGPAGAVLTSPVLRWSLVLLPFLFALAVVMWLVAEAERGYPLFGRLPVPLDPLEDIGMMIILLGAGIVGVIGLLTSVVLARLGRDMLDVGVMGAAAAMGVGPSVPYWVGTAPETANHVAIRIRVPPSLGTLSFRTPSKVVHEAIEAGRISTHDQIAKVGLSTEVPPLGQDSKTDKPEQEVSTPKTATISASQPDSRSRHNIGRLVDWLIHRPLSRGLAMGMAFYFGGALMFGLLAGTSLLWLLTGRFVVGAVLLAASALVVLVAAIGLAIRKSRYAARPYPILGKLSTLTLILVASAGMLLLVYLTLVGISEGRASIPALAIAEPTEATIEHIDGTGDGLSLIWATFGDELASESIAALDTDARGDVVTPCGDPSAQPVPSLRQRIEAVSDDRSDLTVSDRCVVFTANNDAVESGDRVNVLIDAERGIAFLETELSLSGGFMFGPALYMTVGVMLIMTCYHSMRAVWWRKTRSGLAQTDDY